MWLQTAGDAIACWRKEGHISAEVEPPRRRGEEWNSLLEWKDTQKEPKGEGDW